jgi:hypothetical protein
MALSSEERTLLHQRFTHSIGPDGATLVMSQFPIDEAHEPATKDFVHAEVADLRSELVSQIGSVRVEVADLRSELVSEIGSVRGEIGSVRGEIGSLRGEMHSLIRQQTMWFVGTTFTSMGIVAAVVHALS